VSFVALTRFTYRDSPYERDCERENGGIPSSEPGLEQVLAQHLQAAPRRAGEGREDPCPPGPETAVFSV
jgi:hypothetical protein